MNEKILDRIRKLLAKAEDPACTQPEADLFNAKAAELIAEYGVEQALLAASGATRDEIKDRVVVIPAPYAVDKVILLGTVAKPMRVIAVQLPVYARNQNQSRSVRLFGYESDLERVDVLFTSLLVQVATVLARPTPQYGETVVTWRKACFAGFALAVQDMLIKAESKAAQTVPQQRNASGTSTELVLRSRDEQVTAALYEMYPNVKPAKKRAVDISAGGYRAGYEAGQRADLGTPRVKESSTSALEGTRSDLSAEATRRR